MRRSFLPTAFAASLAVAALVVSTASATTRITPVRAGAPLPVLADVTVANADPGPPIRSGFVGVTTEFWDMFKEVGTNPAAPDVPFEQVLENLAPDGGFDLRIGGETTDWTWWPIPGMARPPWARWTLTPTWMAVTQKLLTDLKAQLIIGINMEADDPAVATAELAAFQAGIGPSVPTTYELGNEPELYPKWPYYITKSGQTVYGRVSSYSFPQITSEWDSLAAALGNIPLAGVGYSSFRALPYVQQFLDVSPDLSLLTMHTYALTPQKCQQGGQLKESQLLGPGSLQNLADDVGQWTALGDRNHVAVRVDEINAVTCGGLAGFSNSMGPSLWALNILPLYAQSGVTGVNFETRPNTAQNLIQPTPTATGWQVAVQPEYYGMLAFAQLTPPGSQILRVSTLPSGLLAWAVQTPAHTINIVVTNPKSSAQRVTVKAPSGARGPATTETLEDSAGSLAATTGVTLAGQTISPETGLLAGERLTGRITPRHGIYNITVAPASATILSINDGSSSTPTVGASKSVVDSSAGPGPR